MVVLGIKEEVGAHDSHTNSDNHQYEEHQQHEAVHIVHLQIQQHISAMVRSEPSRQALPNFSSTYPTTVAAASRTQSKAEF